MLWTIAVNVISSCKSVCQNMDAGLVYIWWYSSSGFWPPFKQSRIFLQTCFWELKIILISETKKEYFPQRPSYFIELWPTYPHTWLISWPLEQFCSQMAITFSFLCNLCDTPMLVERKKEVKFEAFSPNVHKEKWLGPFLHEAAHWELQWEQKRKGKGEDGCSNDNLTAQLCGT